MVHGAFGSGPNPDEVYYSLLNLEGAPRSNDRAAGAPIANSLPLPLQAEGVSLTGNCKGSFGDPVRV